MVTIKDVARQAGVAISTVSKVLNGYPGVSNETKEKVHQAIKELNFVPNSIASALSSKKAGRIALLIHMSSQTKARDEIGMQYLAGGIHQAQNKHLDLIVVFFSMLQDKSVEEIIQYFQTQNIEGIIIFGLTKDNEIILKLVELNLFKIVLVDVPIVNAHTSSVGIDQKKAQQDVAEKTLEENKCSSLLYIKGKENSYASDERLFGIKEIAHIKKWNLIVKHGEFSELHARKLTFQYADKVDAIVCSSDLMAIGSMKALIEMDIFRPVCGFDGLILMGYAGMQMNTIQQDFSGVSSKAVDEMQYLLQGGIGRRVLTPYQIERMKYRDVIGMTDEEEKEENEEIHNRMKLKKYNSKKIK